MAKTTLARPEALTPQVQANIIELLKEGNYFDTACRASGISAHGVNQWRRRWEAGDPDASRYHDFFTALALNRGTAFAETTAMRKLKVGSPGWQAQAWFLERRFPKRWAKKETVKQEVSGPSGVPLAINLTYADVEPPTDDEISDGQVDQPGTAPAAQEPEDHPQ